MKIHRLLELEKIRHITKKPGTSWNVPFESPEPCISGIFDMEDICNKMFSSFVPWKTGGCSWILVAWSRDWIIHPADIIFINILCELLYCFWLCGRRRRGWLVTSSY